MNEGTSGWMGGWADGWVRKSATHRQRLKNVTPRLSWAELAATCCHQMLSNLAQGLNRKEKNRLRLSAST